MKKICLSLVVASLVVNAGQNIDLKEGWNLVASKLNNVKVSSFNNSNISTVWSFDSELQKFGAYSPDEDLLKIIEKYKNEGKLAQFSLNAGDGFWVNAKDSVTITLDGDEVNKVIKSLNKGWNLVSFI